MAKEKLSEDLRKQLLQNVVFLETTKAHTFFKYVFWSIYFLVIGILAIYVNQGAITQFEFIGISLILLAVFFSIYGMVSVLNVSFIKKKL